MVHHKGSILSKYIKNYLVAVGFIDDWEKLILYHKLKKVEISGALLLVWLWHYGQQTVNMLYILWLHNLKQRKP